MPATRESLVADIYDPKTLAAMDQAFAAVWRMLRADDPFRDLASDTELKIATGKKLVNLVADGVTDPLRLRNLTVESLLLSRRATATAGIARYRYREYRPVMESSTS
jgi:hypothetical protein